MLKKLLNKYLKGSEKIIFTDYNRSYYRSEFLNKVLFYKKKLEKEWKSNKKNKGIAIKLSRNIDYFAILFASWLNNGYYVPLSKHISKKNFDYQIKKSLVSIVAVEKKIKYTLKK
jgi:long-subunit acyl-CoA synthetase (AMP-forming)